MNKAIFTRTMALMASTWPERKPTKDTFEAYWMALRTMDGEVFERAVAECMQTCTFYPKPAEIFAKVEAMLRRAGLLPPEGELAWAEVMTAQRHWHPDLGWRHGASGFTSPLIEQAVGALGGLARIWNAEPRELGFLRREFLGVYESKRESELAHGGLLQQSLSRPLLAEKVRAE